MLILGGVGVPCEVPVFDWTESGLEIKPGLGARKRTETIDLGVLHWSGSEASASTLFRNIQKQKLGIEFCIDRTGLVWQFCDPVFVDTFDAGKVNANSVGIEIINYGFTWPSWGPVPIKGRDRPTYLSLVEGRKPLRAADFYPEQRRSMIALCKALSQGLHDLPATVPRDGESLLLRTLTDAEVREARGWYGHFHFSERKSDPGTAPFFALAAAGF